MAQITIWALLYMTKLYLLSEGEISNIGVQMTNIKNSIAIAISKELYSVGFKEQSIEYADNNSDDSIIYISLSESQTIMIRIVADDDLQVQIPTKTSTVLGVSDYYNLGSVGEIIAIFDKIKSKILVRREHI